MPRQWQVNPAFGSSNLNLVDFDPPAPPPPGHATVDVAAWSINYRDHLMVEGQYDPRLAFPFVPLSDAAGTVVEVATDVALSPGDRVVPIFSPTWQAGPPDLDAVRKTRGGPVPGVAATHLTLPESELVRIPDHLTLTEAATVPCAAVTAFRALVELGGLQAGQRVLVLGSGGVASWALVLAKALGADVMATTSSSAKASRLEALGADVVVRYDEEPRWGRAARRWAGPEGVDLVIEVGGAGTLAQSLDATRPGGTVAVIGVVAGGTSELSVLPILMKEIRAQGVFVGSRASTEATLACIGEHELRPALDSTMAFEDLPAAFARMASGRHFGKIALEL